MTESNFQQHSDHQSLTPWDVSEFLNNDELIANYIESVAQENDWKFLSRAIGHAAKSIVMSKLAIELRLDRHILYSNNIPKSIPLQAILKALELECSRKESIKAPKIVKISPHDDYSIELAYDDGVVGKFSVVPYLDTGVFTELKDLDYFHKVENHGDSLVWPNEQDLCAGSIYHSMEPIMNDSAAEYAEMERGHFNFSPDHDLKFDEEELDVLEAYHINDVLNDTERNSKLSHDDFLDYSQILTRY